jgi:hypothetical protein
MAPGIPHPHRRQQKVETDDPIDHELPGEHWRPHFEQAMRETFSHYVGPPVPFEDANPHECCEAVWSVFGIEVTPAGLAAATDEQVAAIAQEFAQLGNGEAPPVGCIRQAIADTLARWPVGSLGEHPEPRDTP